MTLVAVAVTYRVTIYSASRSVNLYTPRMDLNAILIELRREHDQLGEAIVAMERLAASGKRRRGRPPAWLSAARQGSEEQPVAKRRGRPRKNVGGA